MSRPEVDREESPVTLFGPPNVAKLRAKGNIDGLVRAARHKDPEVAGEARLALEGHLDELIERLQTKNLAHLAVARDALVLVGPPARDRLVFILEQGHLHRRQDAAFVLGMMKDPQAVEPLCLALHNPDPLLRLIVVEALGKIGDAAAADALRRATGDVDRSVAAAAHKSLKKMGMLPREG